MNELAKLLAQHLADRGRRTPGRPRGLFDVESGEPQGNALRQMAPELYGSLGGLLGTAPDQFEGSVLDPLTARVRSGAEAGFPVGTALGVAPMVGGLLSRAAAMPSQGKRGQLGATVWHGSPHKFNKFDSSKIGTGEGAQAYGHGLYLAESPDVAKSYQTTLTMDRGFNFGGKSGLTREQLQDLVNAREGGKYLDGVTKPSGVADQVIDSIVYGKNGELPRGYKYGSERAALFEKLKQEIAHTDEGALYKVDLPDEHIAKMLDWDKPLSQQAPEVANTLQSLVNDVAGSPNASRAGRDIGRAFNPYSRADLLDEISKRYGWKVKGDTLVKPDGSIIPEAAIQSQLKMRQRGKVYDSAGDLYRDLAQIQGSDASVSAALRNNGIPGIRYLDGGSRGAGTGTSNYVVFPGNEGLLTILERNGVKP